MDYAGQRAGGYTYNNQTDTWNEQDVKPEQGLEQVRAGVAGGQQVPVMLKWPTPGFDNHFVTVTRVENGRVYFNNPWGQEDSMSEAEFKSRLQWAGVPTS